MGIASPASEGYMFIISRLYLFKFVVQETYRVWEHLAQLHVYANTGVRCVSSNVCFLYYLYELTQSIANGFE